MATNTFASQGMNPMLKTFLVKRLPILVLAFCFGFLPTFGEMTPYGMKVLGCFLGFIYSFIVGEFIFGSITSMIALIFTGMFETSQSLFQAFFGQDTFVLLFGILFICALVEEADIGRVVAGFFMNLSMAKKSAFIMIFFFFFSSFIITCFGNSIITVIMYIEFYRVMAKAAGVPPHHKTNSFVLAGIVLCAGIGEIALPFKATPLLMLASYQGLNPDSTLSITEVAVAAFCLCLIINLVYVLIGKFILRVDLSFFDPERSVIEKPAPTKRQKLILIYMLVMTVLLFAAGISSSYDNAVMNVLSTLGLGGVSFGLVILMMCTPCEGKMLLDIRKVGSRFSWDTYFMYTGCVVILPAIGNEEIGFSATMQALVEPLLSGLPFVAFIAMLVIGTIVFTNFMNNFVAPLTFIIFGVSLSGLYPQLNLDALMITLLVCGFIAMATPAATTPAAIVFSHRELISFKNQFVLGCLVCACFAVVMIPAYFVLAAII